MSSGVIKSRGANAKPFNTFDSQQMQRYGFIYADGSYSDEREPRGAILVPRRPSPAHFWDPDSREWFIDGEVMPPVTGGQTQEKVGGENPEKPPTLEQVQAANKPAAQTSTTSMASLTVK